jgi:hypothetical protein
VVLGKLCAPAVLASVIACGPAPLAHPQSSAESLAREVLVALAQRNEHRLRELALDEEEFKRHVWSGLPAARPERNLPLAYVWSDLRQKSDQALRSTLQTHGGKHYQLQSVKFDGPTTDHGTYRVHRETVLVVRDSAGTANELRLLGSMLEKDGQWKVFSYVVDD